MKISEITSDLNEGPILNKIGSAVGKGVGTAAKAAGALAGGVAGLGSALKKGFQAGKSTVAAAGDDDNTTTLSPAVQKALDVLKKLTPQDQKAAISALQNPPKPAQAAPKPAGTANVGQKTSAPAQAATKTAQPAATGSASSVKPSSTAPTQPTATANKAGSDSFEKAKGDIRRVQSGTKPIPDKVAQGIQADLAKLAKGDKESGVFAAQKIMNFARAGYDVSKLQPQWTANAKAGERFLTQSVYYAITKMLKEHNLSWADLGLRIRLVENTNKVVGVNFV